MKTLSLLTLLSLLLASCSYFQYEPARVPATVLQEQNEILEVFEFRSSNIVAKTDYRTLIQNYLKTYSVFQGTYITGNEIAVEFVEDSTLPKGIAYFPEFSVKDNNYKIIVLHSKEAINDSLASAELINFFTTLKDSKYFVSHFAAFEMYYNAIERDPVTAQNWAKIREAAANKNVPSEFGGPQVADAMKTRAAEWAKEKEDYEEMANKAVKELRKSDGERRAVIEALDKATDDKQFKNLVAMNDRAGAADLLKKYLPWEQMAPFEKRYWENYLQVMVKPLPMDQRILIYRGIDDDFIYSAYKGGKELDKETAQKEGKVFVMSSILTKNQGTWNRRLRSLTAMYDKFIATGENLDNEFTKSARIVTMFVNHSREPKGSPFLSLTPKFSVASLFGGNKMSAYALDPRLVSFNFASKYKNEVEFLLPLMVFPEDVVGFYDRKIHTEATNSEDLMKKLFKEKLIKAHGEENGSKIYDKVLENSKEYFDSALNRYDGKVTAGVKAPATENFMVKFFNSIFGSKKTPPPPQPVVPVLKGNSCMDIISSFWK